MSDDGRNSDSATEWDTTFDYSGPPATGLKAPGADAVLQAVESLRLDSKYSDLVIQCGDQEWPVHKAIVCPQSAFIARACDGGFKEGSEGRITLEGQDPFAVQGAIEFMYNGKLNQKPASTNGKPKCLRLCVLVFILADFLDAPNLQHFASKRFCGLVEDRWRTDDFAEAIRELYQSSPERNATDRMRSAAISVASKNAFALLEYDCFRAFRSVVSDFKLFAMQFQLQTLKSNDNRLRLFSCDLQDCRRSFYIGDITERLSALSCPFCGTRSIKDRGVMTTEIEYDWRQLL